VWISIVVQRPFHPGPNARMLSSRAAPTCSNLHLGIYDAEHTLPVPYMLFPASLLDRDTLFSMGAAQTRNFWIMMVMQVHHAMGWDDGLTSASRRCLYDVSPSELTVAFVRCIRKYDSYTRIEC